MVPYKDMIGPASSASLSRFFESAHWEGGKAAFLTREPNLEEHTAEAGPRHSGSTAQHRGRMYSWEPRQCHAATGRLGFGLLGPWHPQA